MNGLNKHRGNMKFLGAVIILGGGILSLVLAAWLSGAIVLVDGKLVTVPDTNMATLFFIFWGAIIAVGGIISRVARR